MSLRILAASAIVMFSAGLAHATDSGVPVEPKGFKIAQACGWYAVGTCSRRPGPARRSARRFGGYVVRTDNVANFRPGWFCSVMGPGNKAAAYQNRDYMRSVGLYSAYIKFGC